VLDNKWVILELIGKGAMGEIYLARQLNLKRDVAIKVVSEELLKDFGDDPDEIETYFQRFKREVHAMARVRHPNVLQIFDYGSTVIQKGQHPLKPFAYRTPKPHFSRNRKGSSKMLRLRIEKIGWSRLPNCERPF
jgi:serine/threonine-protein kinase